nr:unnamed protein product [Callosobruchus chinensis]
MNNEAPPRSHSFKLFLIYSEPGTTYHHRTFTRYIKP